MVSTIQVIGMLTRANVDLYKPICGKAHVEVWQNHREKFLKDVGIVVQSVMDGSRVVDLKQTEATVSTIIQALDKSKLKYAIKRTSGIDKDRYSDRTQPGLTVNFQVLDQRGEDFELAEKKKELDKDIARYERQIANQEADLARLPANIASDKSYLNQAPRRQKESGGGVNGAI